MRKARLKNQYGKWAIVTGASSGIGLELATQLANAGFKLVINSRHLEKLQEVEGQLKQNSTIEIKIVASDVAENEGIEQIIQMTKDLNVGLFIASAGYGTSGNFIDSLLHSEINMLRVNCEGLLSLTHYYSQQLVQRKRHWGFTYTLMKGKENVLSEVNLMMISYNLRRLMSILGVNKLKEVLKGLCCHF